MRDAHAHPVFARAYPCLGALVEHHLAPYRRRLLAEVSGRAVEVGAGNGLTFVHYPPTVTQVLAVEPEPHLRRLAERAAVDAAVPVAVVAGAAEQLPLGDGSVDAVVVSLVLCSVEDVPAALAEIRRVLHPGGQLRFLEHVRADGRALSRVQRLLDATVWPHLAGGCHTARDTPAAIERAGFRIGRLHRFRLPDSSLQHPVSPHVVGTATRD